MSYSDGIAALHLSMPPRVPRTEYSAESHWPLVSRVTGYSVNENSPDIERQTASLAFRRAFDYSFAWSVLYSNEIFGELQTHMGHAVYAAGGVDYDPVISCPFTDVEEVLRFDPEVYGVVDKTATKQAFEAHYKKNCENFPDEVNMTGVYVTCVSGLIAIFGWDMLLYAAGYDPGRFGEMINRYAKWIQQYFDALAESDVPVVMVHDDIVWTAGAIFRPAFYREFIFPNYKKYFKPLIDSGKRIMFTSDGNYTEFIDDIAGCGVHGFIMEPMTDMAYIAEKYGKTHVFIGNADTRILLYDTREQIRGEVERCMAIGKSCPGFFLAVGNHIPSNTPVDNCLYYDEVYRELSKR